MVKISTGLKHQPGKDEMIQKDIIARLVSAGLNHGQAEVALLMADGAKMPDLQKIFGSQAIQHVRFLKANIGPRSQIKAVVDSCWQLMLLEKDEEKQREEMNYGFSGKGDPR
jgi:DNA-binding transcriptional regulator PaaX